MSFSPIKSTEPLAEEKINVRESVHAPPNESRSESATKLETAPEKTEKKIPEHKENSNETLNSLRGRLALSKKKSIPIPQVRDEITLQVEKIMSKGLDDIYKDLDPIKKQELKIRGEEIALEIRDLLRATKVNLKKIFSLLFEWLKILPGVNKFFLEQDAKIKADLIFALNLRSREIKP